MKAQTPTSRFKKEDKKKTQRHRFYCSRGKPCLSPLDFNCGGGFVTRAGAGGGRRERERTVEALWKYFLLQRSNTAPETQRSELADFPHVVSRESPFL